jgi:hypothetical protein
MHNILKKIVTISIYTVTVGFVGCGAFLLGQHDQSTEVDHLLDLLVKESQTVSQFEYEAVKLAETYEGEAKGQLDEWVWEMSAPAMPSAIVNRVNDERFPDTVLGVLLQPLPSGKGLAINALGDHIPEDLSTKRGQLALLEAAQVLVAHYDGTFVPSHAGHSWATPKAAEGHSYFEGLDPVVAGSGHQYFADKSLASTAPKVSLRPKARLADAVYAALVEANTN